MRERIRSLGGTAEIGPRVVGGYRVRVRFALSGAAQPTGPAERGEDAPRVADAARAGEVAR